MLYLGEQIYRCLTDLDRRGIIRCRNHEERQKTVADPLIDDSVTLQSAAVAASDIVLDEATAATLIVQLLNDVVSAAKEESSTTAAVTADPTSLRQFLNMTSRETIIYSGLPTRAMSPFYDFFCGTKDTSARFHDYARVRSYVTAVKSKSERT